MKNLKYLNLSNNALAQLDLNTFDENKRMLVLDLSNNLLKDINLGTFDQLTTLISLSLAENKLNNIPLGLLDKTQYLLHLNLAKNNINDFPLGIFDGLNALISINLSYNRLKNKILALGIFDELKAVEKIDISGCNITSLSLGIFDETKKLNFVNLSHNNLDDIDGYIFDETNLQFLDLSSNKIRSFPFNILKTSVKKLYLNNNLISRLDSEPSANETLSVELIDLKHNDLAFFSADFFDWTVYLKLFDIGANPWECVCLEDLIKILNSRFIRYSKKDYFDGSVPTCIVGEVNSCEYKITYRNKDKIEFLSYFES